MSTDSTLTSKGQTTIPSVRKKRGCDRLSIHRITMREYHTHCGHTDKTMMAELGTSYGSVFDGFGAQMP